MDNKNSSGCSIGLSGTLFIVFLILKLTNVINWSWWWVTAPLWIPAIIAIIFVIFIAIIGLISNR